MKKNAFSAVLFVVSIILISGCNLNNQESGYDPVRSAYAPEDKNRLGRFNNLSEEERRQMIEARMQLAAKACQDKA